MNTNHLIESRNNIAFQPSETLINNWRIWIAKEVISQLKTKNSVQISFAEISNIIDLNKINISDHKIWIDFKEQFDLANLKCDTFSKTDSIKYQLDIIYSKTIFNQLESLSSKLQREYCDLLVQNLSKDLEKASPEKLLDFLKNLAKLLLLHGEIVI